MARRFAFARVRAIPGIALVSYHHYNHHHQPGTDGLLLLTDRHSARHPRRAFCPRGWWGWWPRARLRRASTLRPPGAPRRSSASSCCATASRGPVDEKAQRRMSMYTLGNKIGKGESLEIVNLDLRLFLTIK